MSRVTIRFVQLKYIFSIAAGLCMFLSMQCPAETLSEYQHFLNTTTQNIQSCISLEEKQANSSNKILDQIIDRTPSSMSVTVQPEQKVRTDFTWLKQNLKRIQSQKGSSRIEQMESLLSRIKSVQQATWTPIKTKSPSPAEAQATLKSILTRKEYQRSITEDLYQYVTNMIGNLLERINISESTANWIASAIVIGVKLAFALALILLVVRFIQIYLDEKKHIKKTPQHQIIKVVKPTVESILESAEMEAAGGNYREAYRHLYLASILLLDRQKLVKYADGTTNWEYLRMLSRQDQAETQELFRKMTLSFDRMIYGKRPVSSDDYQTCIQQFKALREALV